MKTLLITSDYQIPYHDPLTLQAVHKLIKELKPTIHILNGDIVDCPALSVFEKKPMEKVGLLAELKVARLELEHQRDLSSKTDIQWQDGNHEARVDAYILREAPALHGWPGLDLKSILTMDKLHVTYRPYDEGTIIGGKLRVVHGTEVRQHSGATAKAMFGKYGMSGVSGHTHRLGTYYHTFPGTPETPDKFYVWAENGCLCSLKPEWTQDPDWQQGFTVVYLMDNGRFSLQQIPIIDHKFVFEGELFTP